MPEIWRDYFNEELQMPKRKSILSFLCGVFVLFFGCRIGSSQDVDIQEKKNDVEIVKGELEAVADSAAQTNDRVSKLEKELADYKKANDAKTKQVGNFNFSGDVRVRYEGFFQQGAINRNRERVRLRFNVTGKLSDDFSGGFSLATGTLDDPVSTNQTMTSFLNRKNFGVDKAFITYKPSYAKFLKLEAGKVAYPWYRTALTFDNDVNPEGFSETLSFDLKSSVLKNITFVGFQLPINEVSKGNDSFIFGGQMQVKFQLAPKVRLSLYGAGVNFRNSDVIAKAQVLPGITSGTLAPSLSNTNTLRIVNGVTVGYANLFAYVDTIVKLDIESGNPRFPVMAQFNYVNNVRADKENKGYWADLMIGRTQEAKDMQFGYSYIRIEKDAVLAAFNESDLRAPTDVLNHRLLFSYLFAKNVTAQFTAFVGKKMHTSAKLIDGFDDTNLNYLKRLQFDIIYKF
jgi:hypothetical protein